MPSVKNNTGKNNTVGVVIITALVVAVLLVGGYFLLQPKRPQTLGEKLDAAAEEISKGIDKAAGSFDDRSPVQKAADDASAAAQELADKAKAALQGK
jgi:hypothetical protein